jgi:hypothetical protein
MANWWINAAAPLKAADRTPKAEKRKKPMTNSAAMRFLFVKGKRYATITTNKNLTKYFAGVMGKTDHEQRSNSGG